MSTTHNLTTITVRQIRQACFRQKKAYQELEQLMDTRAQVRGSSIVSTLPSISKTRKWLALLTTTRTRKACTRRTSLSRPTTTHHHRSPSSTSTWRLPVVSALEPQERICCLRPATSVAYSQTISAVASEVNYRLAASSHWGLKVCCVRVTLAVAFMRLAAQAWDGFKVQVCFSRITSIYALRIIMIITIIRHMMLAVSMEMTWSLRSHQTYSKVKTSSISRSSRRILSFLQQVESIQTCYLAALISLKSKSSTQKSESSSSISNNTRCQRLKKVNRRSTLSSISVQMPSACLVLALAVTVWLQTRLTDTSIKVRWLSRRIKREPQLT